MDGSVDLDAYFARIGYGGPRAPTLDVLSALHLLHPKAIPFESLDPLLGRPVRIDAASLEAKLVRGRRGGYCFEHNGVFLRVLAALGFAVTPLAARVRWMLPDDAQPTPLSHMLTRVDLADGCWICDVGFGGQSPTAPLRLEAGVEQTTPHGTYRIVDHDGRHDVQMRLPERWQTMYRFSLEPQSQRDYEVFNWFTSSHPTSRFTNNLVAARVVGERRLNLFNTEYAVHWPDGRTERTLVDDPAALHALLTDSFGIAVDLSDIEGVFGRLPPPA